MNAVAIMSIDSQGIYFTSSVLNGAYIYDPRVPYQISNSLHPK